MTSFLKEKYEKEAIPAIKSKFDLRNVMAVPKILKVTLNCGTGKFIKEKDALDQIMSDLKIISGQKPVLTRSKKSISGFKIRQGQEIGAKVTLRGPRMWNFMERLITAALPRVRDFRGIELGNVDKYGNLNLAIKEHIVFPEIVPENVNTIFGFQISVSTTAKSQQEGLELFRLLGFPIKKES